MLAFPATERGEHRFVRGIGKIVPMLVTFAQDDDGAIDVGMRQQTIEAVFDDRFALESKIPLPAAGMTAHTPALLLIGRVSFRRNQLDKGFTLLDHAEIITRLFLEGVEAVLQVEHLRLEYSVAFLEQLQLLFLNFEFTAQLHNLGKAAVTEPEFVLQADEHQDQENNQCLHRSMDARLEGLQG